METRRTNKGGRPALADPAKHRHVLYLNDRENARFLSQWEQSGVTVNYNQVVKALHSNFSEKKALAFLYKLEKATTELSMLNRQVIDLTNECKELWLPK